MKSKRRTTPLEMQMVSQMYNTGKSITAIREQTGRDFQTIRRMLVDSGIEVRNKNAQRRLDKHNAKKRPASHPMNQLTAMEILACCGYGSGLEPKEIAYRLGYKDRQSARDLLKSAFRKIKARTTKEELL